MMMETHAPKMYKLAHSRKDTISVLCTANNFSFDQGI